MKRFSLIHLLLSGLLAGLSAAHAASIDDFVPLTYSDTNGSIPYRLFIPTNYTSLSNYPLVLYLHGSGERGTDNQTQFGEPGALVFITNQTQNPSFMVAPQCPPNGRWTNSDIRQLIFGIVGEVQSEFSIDPDRIYVTGLSMGGEGTWDQIVSFPDTYAAAVPMSDGYTGSQPMNNIAAIPIWDFHAANDDVNPVTLSRVSVKQARSIGARVVYTEYADGLHSIWSVAYATPILMNWIYSQHRGFESPQPPFLKISGPTDQSWLMNTNGNSPIMISGTASDGATGPTSVIWTNFATGAGGTATGTTSWLENDVSPAAADTNLIVVTGSGTSWFPEWGGTTTFNDALSILSPGAAGYLAITSFAFDGTNISLTWYAASNRMYRVEWTTNLVNGSWTDLPGDVRSSGFSASRTDPATNASNACFYRVELLP